MPTAPSEFCDYACPFAEFPPEGSEGLCRTMGAVYCKKLRRVVHKNLPCHWRRERGTTAD